MRTDKYFIWILALFVVMVTVMPTGAAETDASNLKKVILQMTTTLENSDTQLYYNYAENIGDGRGITFGCIGFCTGTYDGNILIKHYTELNPDNTLAKYIPALNKIDAGAHNAADGEGNPSLVGLDGFIKDVENCDDPLFIQAQLDLLDELYYNPAMELAENAGCEYPITKAFIYDSCVNHGENGASRIIKQAGKTPAQGADEIKFLENMISAREQIFDDTDRVPGFRAIIGNPNLIVPFKFSAYGDTFVIDGNLDMGESQQGTTIDESNSNEDVEKTVDENDSSEDADDDTVDEDDSSEDADDDTVDEDDSSEDETKNKHSGRHHRNSERNDKYSKKNCKKFR